MTAGEERRKSYLKELLDGLQNTYFVSIGGQCQCGLKASDAGADDNHIQLAHCNLTHRPLEAKYEREDFHGGDGLV